MNFTSSSPLPTAVSFPDGTSVGITYETTPGFSPKVTGRINQITLREGGTVTYTYGGSNNGINCTYQTVPVLTRTLGNGDTTTYTLAYSIIGTGPTYRATNTVIDPGGNKTVYTFTGFNSTGVDSGTSQLLTQVQRYQGTSVLLTTDVYCYDGVTSNCPTNTMAAGPTTEVDVYHTISGMSVPSRTQTLFDIYGNVTYLAYYDFGGASPVRATTITYYQSGTPCGALSSGNHINDRACEVSTTQNGSTVADAKYTYDQYGNRTTTSLWTGSTWIGQTTANVYNANGTISKSYDVANNETDYAYDSTQYSNCSSCTNYPFPTKITDHTTTMNSLHTWDGLGGVQTSTTDYNNGNVTTLGYVDSGGGADPFWRARIVTDPTGIVDDKDYFSTGQTDWILFNSSQSVLNPVTLWDAYGRPSAKQVRQTPTSTNYDTVTTAYSWNGANPVVSTSEPCSATLGGVCPTLVHTSAYDALGRLVSEATTSNETVSNTFTN